MVKGKVFHDKDPWMFEEHLDPHHMLVVFCLHPYCIPDLVDIACLHVKAQIHMPDHCIMISPSMVRCIFPLYVWFFSASIFIWDILSNTRHSDVIQTMCQLYPSCIPMYEFEHPYICPIIPWRKKCSLFSAIVILYPLSCFLSAVLTTTYIWVRNPQVKTLRMAPLFPDLDTDFTFDGMSWE